ncbi:MOSC domain-containing protein [Chitinimonas sp. BJB300]|uniref:MOSC domain-containing protein n=1 Tax=Chitinimonas sp. BJB300 TaxID=1559339 RepID=UPI0013040861|nr:MOSC domain-containing protein [Chitinimonas sp. BJB300]
MSLLILSESPMQLVEIYIHPLKSCRGNRLDSALVEAMGLEHDRRWMLIDIDGNFMTGRQYPKLVLIEVVADEAGATFSARGADTLRVEHQEMVERLPVVVWRSAFDAQTGSWNADFWFSDFLGVACRLVYIGTDTSRRSNIDPTVPVGFADGYPLLLIGSASLADLNTRLSQPVTMRHFRPNLVINTEHAYAEDDWRHIRIGDVMFENVKPCARCIFTTVDPDSATLHAERQPLEALNTYRRSESGTIFGVNLVARSQGVLRLNDPVVVLD